MRFPPTHYVPFLKGKMGEYSALRELYRASRDALTPLIDVPRVPLKNKMHPLEEHLDKQAARIANAWGPTHPLFLDLHDLPLGVRTSAGQHHVTHLGKALADKGVPNIPVTGIDRDAAYHTAVRGLLGAAGDVAIRLLPDDIDTPSMLDGDLLELLNDLGVSRERTHLLLDLRSVSRHDVGFYVSACEAAINALSEVDKYRTLTVAGSSMPQGLSQVVKAKSTGRIRRKENDIWIQLQRSAALARRPNFGDYAAVHPDLMDLDLTKITVAADIRYTVKGGMLIIRGNSIKHNPLGFKQYYQLAKTLASDPAYCGQGFSWGDDAIYERAYYPNSIGTGNKQTWVQIATNHHLEFIVQELPALLLRVSGPASPAAP